VAEIKLTDVKKSFDRTEVLHDVNLTFGHGEFVVILGPSGCGKSTLLRLIAGLEDASAGTIEIDGEIVNNVTPKKRGCAMVFQNYALYPHMSVANNIGYALKVSGVPRTQRQAKIGTVAETLGLSPYLDRKPHQLSGGQRQRVAMGRALIREPRVFLFDEPLSNLDAKLRAQMRIEIRDFHRRVNVTSIFVTHDQVEAMTLADRLIVMRDGLVEQVGTPAEVYHHPKTEFVAGFIGSPPMNFVACTVDNDGHHAVLGDGQRFALNGSSQNAPRGRSVNLGVRPEHFEIAHKDAVGEALKLRLEFIEELGATRLVHGDLAGQRVVVSTNLEVDHVQVVDSHIAVLPKELTLFDEGRAILNETRVSFNERQDARNPSQAAA